VANAVSTFLNPTSSILRDFVLVVVTNQTKLWRSRRQYMKTMKLPTELLLMIFDIVIEEGIIWVDQCDHTKFPYIQSILSESHNRYRYYDPYYRLRLVCRSFNDILGTPISHKWTPSSIFPLSTAIRALILDLEAWPKTGFQLLSVEPPPYRRIIHLDVTCDLSSSSNRPNLSDFLSTCAGQALHNVQHLIL